MDYEKGLEILLETGMLAVDNLDYGGFVEWLNEHGGDFMKTKTIRIDMILLENVSNYSDKFKEKFGINLSEVSLINSALAEGLKVLFTKLDEKKS